jgi:hypothetical protein
VLPVRVTCSRSRSATLFMFALVFGLLRLVQVVGHRDGGESGEDGNNRNNCQQFNEREASDGGQPFPEFTVCVLHGWISRYSKGFRYIHHTIEW